MIYAHIRSMHTTLDQEPYSPVLNSCAMQTPRVSGDALNDDGEDRLADDIRFVSPDTKVPMVGDVDHGHLS